VRRIPRPSSAADPCASRCVLLAAIDPVPRDRGRSYLLIVGPSSGSPPAEATSVSVRKRNKIGSQLARSLFEKHKKEMQYS